MQYRPEIDGLRSVAIFPVLLFHAGLPVFERGYLGVDIFFVISGYLIAGLILEDVRVNKFCIVDFYMRRARRLLPALFFVIFISSIAAWWSLLPADMLDFSKSVLAALTFTSNFYFWQTGDYFAADSALRPLLHLWSLGIEEQFYLFLPWLLVWRHGYLARGRGGLWLLGAAMVSLLLACWWMARSPTAVFYLPITRAWELLVGAVVAWYGWGVSSSGRNGGRSRWQAAGALLGLLMVLGVLTLPYSLPWPVLTVSLPLVVGTALVLACARGDSAVARLLSWRPFVLLGWVSYSAYLWHQPVFAFARHNLVPLEGWAAWGAVVVVVILAGVSWRWVEQPFRGNGRFGGLSGRALGWWAGGGTGVLVLAMLLVWLGQGVPQRYSKQALGMVTYAQDNFQRFTEGYRVGTCFLDEHTTKPVFGDACHIQAGDKGVIWGDSHAAALYQGFALLPEKSERWAQFTGSGCPPLLDFDVAWRPFCRAMNDVVLEQIRLGQPQVVLLHANWLLYAHEGGDVGLALENTVRRLRQVAPLIQVVVLGGGAQWQPSLPLHILRRGVDWAMPPVKWLENHDLGRVHALDQGLHAAVVRGLGDAREGGFIFATEIVCRNNECPVTAEIYGEWMPFVWDYGHMTTAAAKWFASELKEKINNRAEK